MNKTRIVLHRENLEPPIVNLPIAHYGFHFLYRSDYKVRTSRRAGEIYFRLTEMERVHHDRKPTLREITEEFLAIIAPEDAVQFLSKYGPLIESKRGLPSGKSTIKWSELLIIQAEITRLWETPPSKWNELVEDLLKEGENPLRLDIHNQVKYFSLTTDFDETPPVLIANSNSVMDDLAADLLFAALAGLPSAFCARADCHRLFQKTTKHERKYCSTECAHLESVRNYRARITRSK